MKFTRVLSIMLAAMCLFTACQSAPAEQTPAEQTPDAQKPGNQTPAMQAPIMPAMTDPVQVQLADEGITVDGEAAGTDTAAAVYVANDIIYYEAGKDFTYGEGSEEDAHTRDEAAAHTVVHITKPGTYSLSGKLSLGQVAIDLGKDAKKDPEAVVNLVLNGVDITCKVAPGVIFYNVYECGSDDEETATKDVDTSAAGANVLIADGTVNTVNGSYVARIYEPESVVLNEDKTEVEDADKLHKYDAAFYSKRTMNVFGGAENTGILNINAENEGLDSELHLSVVGGDIRIRSGNDGINTNEDNVSVTAIYGGKLTIKVTGETGEGDGIDSNGWLVINGGTVIAEACAKSADAGIDSDMGIHINGGTVLATGSMLDRIEGGSQNYVAFSFGGKQAGGKTLTLKAAEGNVVAEFAPENAFSVLIYSSPDLVEGSYTLTAGDQQITSRAASAEGGMGGGMRPGGMRPEDDFTPPEGFEGGTPPAKPEGSKEFPEGFTPPDGWDGQERPSLDPGKFDPNGTQTQT